MTLYLKANSFVKKAILIFCCILVCKVGFTQGGGQQSINAPALTAVLSPAPNAYELTKYSGLSINASTGGFQTAIPLSKLKVGTIELPISLSYNSGNGIKVNQIATRVGMSWNLEAGGAVTRTVMDKADELYKMLTAPANFREGNFSQDSYNYLDSATRGAYDTQSDLFSFNFNGYSGKFYLKPNHVTEVVQLAASPLKIETNFYGHNSGDWTIKITDPAGTQYYFGGSKATEKSKTSSFNCGKNYDAYIPTAWYLIAIKGVKGEYIDFEYSSCTYDYYADISETLIRTPSTTLLQSCAGDNCPQRNESQICPNNLSTKGVILQGIYSKFSEVKFNYSTRSDLIGDFLLSSVKYYKKDIIDTLQKQLYNNYDLEYVYSSNSDYYNFMGNGYYLNDRAFLNKVTRSLPGITPQEYKISYYNINSLPSRLSFAQDYWGYFNGKNNTHLIPTGKAEHSALFGVLADRSPNGSVSYYGLMSKIVYPGGGTDSLEYEPNTIFENRYFPASSNMVNQRVQGTGTKDPVFYTLSFSLDEARNVNFNLSCSYSGIGVNDLIHQYSALEIRDANYNLVYNYALKIDTSYSGSITLPSGSYTLKWVSYGQAAVGDLSFIYQPEGYYAWGNYEVGGVRVKRNITISTIGSVLKKKMIYASLENQNQSSGKIRSYVNTGLYYSNLRDAKVCYVLGYPITVFCDYRIAYSKPINDLSYPSGTHIYYSDVIELKDDSWDYGGKSRHFLGGEGLNAQILFGNNTMFAVPISNSSYEIGLENIEKDFITTGSLGGNYTYKTVKEIRKNFIIDTRVNEEASNYVIKSNYTPAITYNPPDETQFAPFDVQMFNHRAIWIYVDTVTTTEYDLEGNNPIQTQQFYTYNNIKHYQPNEISYVNSLGDVRTEIKKYPHEMYALTSQPVYQQLIQQNRITVPLVNTFKNNLTHIQTDSLVYGQWSGNIYEPQNIYFRTQNNTAEPFITYHAYDTKGHLLSQSRTNGLKYVYLYGYREELPIVQVQNAAINEIFFENFEDNSTAALLKGHTGLRYYAGSYQVNWAKPNNKDYQISYFYLSGDKWYYKVIPYTYGMVLSDGSGIDDIAVYPVDAYIKSFTYDPVFGVTGIVDEKGFTTSYEYDVYGRLINIKDHNGYIVKNYVYNETGEPYVIYYNTLKSQKFTKQCTIGQGSEETYVVSAGKYSSTLSQADADNQALADIIANGQTYANLNGICTMPKISLVYTNSTKINPSTSQRSGGVQTLIFKDTSNNVVYTFTEAQLVAGASIDAGTYNLQIDTYGTIAGFPNFYGWNNFKLIDSLNNVLNTIYHNGASSYTQNGVSISGSKFTIMIDWIDTIE
ncbi:DUF5977 domain-containing protein [Pedobacter montanisoli]|uniref:DUF5977 domain-containing protein n=1 Tax=Pedobacter montanisoli TaxID=2923277 RepID=A0ABS9ZZX8_9SPHI|nr:DUF5977 domain-containing protein [Pedobacter montanisoli]MCJ0743875.1 DUF5977 domain-containing protein [Pedobacter montanisoli]